VTDLPIFILGVLVTIVTVAAVLVVGSAEASQLLEINENRD